MSWRSNLKDLKLVIVTEINIRLVIISMNTKGISKSKGFPLILQKLLKEYFIVFSYKTKIFMSFSKYNEFLLGC